MGTDICIHSRLSPQLSSHPHNLFQHCSHPCSKHTYHPYPSPQMTVSIPKWIPQHCHMIMDMPRYLINKWSEFRAHGSFSIHSTTVLLHFHTRMFIARYILSPLPWLYHKLRHRFRGTTMDALPIPAITTVSVVKPTTVAVLSYPSPCSSLARAHACIHAHTHVLWPSGLCQGLPR